MMDQEVPYGGPGAGDSRIVIDDVVGSGGVDASDKY
jgi:hypothetical protein